ncbi:FtsX-like permease family protein [Paracoccus sp. Z118]|uniref:FtsX-like permease family protein n=1 Tax=Paracoccus sp. Z118 TaxID=2851017 RepID=UPI001C2C0F06|nr:FtsX-like permease family protein [Paracoccus sp. Z118]MBV0893045.1 FtsX-like permease family protein [Paracoccus sp. Z118]
MTAILTRLLGRLPIGWLQLTHNRARLIAALAGVAFANVLVFVQLAIMGSMSIATGRPYDFFEAGLMISAADADSLTDGSNVARQWLFQALAHPQVTAGAPLFVGNVTLQHAGTTMSLTTFGVDPAQPGFLAPALRGYAELLTLPDSGIIDRLTRGLEPGEADALGPASPVTLEVRGRTLTLYGGFAGGGGFGVDGYLVVSDQTFLKVVQNRQTAAPDHILLALAPGADAGRVAHELRALVSDRTLRIRPYAQARAEDIAYQQTRRPTGIIFGFGVVIGILVGLVIVYQVLSTDVADHIREYATFKAMGYRQRFLLGIVLEEALILALLGAGPGYLVARALIGGMRRATGLPLELGAPTVVAVVIGTVVACALSGALATRRLASADPADLF